MVIRLVCDDYISTFVHLKLCLREITLSQFNIKMSCLLVEIIDLQWNFRIYEWKFYKWQFSFAGWNVFSINSTYKGLNSLTYYGSYTERLTSVPKDIKILPTFKLSTENGNFCELFKISWIKRFSVHVISFISKRMLKYKIINSTVRCWYFVTWNTRNYWGKESALRMVQNLRDGICLII